jgi:hypothetical protein
LPAFLGLPLPEFVFLRTCNGVARIDARATPAAVHSMLSKPLTLLTVAGALERIFGVVLCHHTNHERI